MGGGEAVASVAKLDFAIKEHYKIYTGCNFAEILTRRTDSLMISMQ